MQSFAFGWKSPWKAVEPGTQASAIQQRLELEITQSHQLFGKGAVAFGLRQDNDDVVAVLNNGTFVNVHLVWGSEPEPFPDKYPDWFSYGTEADFCRAMEQDAKDYGDVS